MLPIFIHFYKSSYNLTLSWENFFLLQILLFTYKVAKFTSTGWVQSTSTGWVQSTLGGFHYCTFLKTSGVMSKKKNKKNWQMKVQNEEYLYSPIPSGPDMGFKAKRQSNSGQNLDKWLSFRKRLAKSLVTGRLVQRLTRKLAPDPGFAAGPFRSPGFSTDRATNERFFWHLFHQRSVSLVALGGKDLRRSFLKLCIGYAPQTT